MYATTAEGGDAQRTIARLWDITLAAIQLRHPAAAWLLHVMAHYAPDNIPREMLGGKPSAELDVSDSAATLDRIEIDEMLGLLASYNMITITHDVVSMHRLVQAVMLTTPLPPGCGYGQREALDTALEWLNQALTPDPDSDVAAWPLLRALLPHADNIMAHYPRGDASKILGYVLNEFSVFLRIQGDYHRASTLNASALEIHERALGVEAPETITCLGNLAFTYSSLGRHADALSLREQVLARTENALGPDHPDTARSLNNLAATCTYVGRYTKALGCQERALAIAEAAFGPEHRNVGICLNNLAGTYRSLGRYAEALPVAQRALAITEAELGPEHPSTGIRLGVLAAVYSALGRHTEALPLDQRALTITESALGADHPAVANDLSNLADTLKDMGRAADALPLEQRAVEITKAALGADHPDVATRLVLQQ
jgi:tetratricopeptide (TPR) repeat protein